MKTRRISLLLISLLFLFSSIIAGEVNQQDAQKVAKNFYYERMHQFGDGIEYKDIQIINT